MLETYSFVHKNEVKVIITSINHEFDVYPHTYATNSECIIIFEVVKIYESIPNSLNWQTGFFHFFKI